MLVKVTRVLILGLLFVHQIAHAESLPKLDFSVLAKAFCEVHSIYGDGENRPFSLLNRSGYDTRRTDPNYHTFFSEGVVPLKGLRYGLHVQDVYYDGEKVSEQIRPFLQHEQFTTTKDMLLVMMQGRDNEKEFLPVCRNKNSLAKLRPSFSEFGDPKNNTYIVSVGYAKFAAELDNKEQYDYRARSFIFFLKVNNHSHSTLYIPYGIKENLNGTPSDINIINKYINGEDQRKLIPIEISTIYEPLKSQSVMSSFGQSIHFQTTEDAEDQYPSESPYNIPEFEGTERFISPSLETSDYVFAGLALAGLAVISKGILDQPGSENSQTIANSESPAQVCEAMQDVYSCTNSIGTNPNDVGYQNCGPIGYKTKVYDPGNTCNVWYQKTGKCFSSRERAQSVLCN